MCIVDMLTQHPESGGETAKHEGLDVLDSASGLGLHGVEAHPVVVA